MAQFIPIEFEKTSCNCPICGAFSEHVWSYAKKSDKETVNRGLNIQWQEKIEELVFSQCHHCKRHTIWLDWQGETKMLYPISGTAPFPNLDMPEDIEKDFNEARNIVELSPRGAAALLRLVVQKLCKHLGEKGENMNEDIGKLFENGLSEKMRNALDIVRVIGNNAVHPGQIDLTDDRETAYKLFSIVNIITDKLITEPKQIDDLYESKVPESAKTAIEKRDKHS